MAFGFFRVIEPGLTYIGRTSFLVDIETLPIDPLVKDVAIEGEWLAPDSNNKITRPFETAATGDHPDIDKLALAFPTLTDKSRTDAQSSGKASVLVHKGALCLTAIFAIQRGVNGNTTVLEAAPYAIGDKLVVGRFLDLDDETIVRSGLVLEGSDPFTGSIDEAARGTLVGISTLVAATVVRAPHAVDRKQVIELIIE